jgi:flagellar biosynthesis component FlhA
MPHQTSQFVPSTFPCFFFLMVPPFYSLCFFLFIFCWKFGSIEKNAYEEQKKKRRFAEEKNRKKDHLKKKNATKIVMKRAKKKTLSIQTDKRTISKSFTSVNNACERPKTALQLRLGYFLWMSLSEGS